MGTQVMIERRAAQRSSSPRRTGDSVKRLVIAMTALACLVACDRDSEKRQAAQTAEWLKSEARAKAKVSAPITPRTLQVGPHEVLVIDVPSVEFGTLVENQRCYVWRDAEFRVSSMSCPHQPAMAHDLGDDESTDRR